MTTSFQSNRPLTSVLCTTHGLRYDPATNGCVRCRKSSAPPPRPRTPWLLAGLALCLATATGVVVYERVSSPVAAVVSAHGPTRAEILAEAKNVHVVIYSASWCASCSDAKTFLWQNGVAYEEHDIDKERGAREKAFALNAGHTVPVIDIEGEVVVGADTDKVIATLERVATRHLQAAAVPAPVASLRESP